MGTNEANLSLPKLAEASGSNQKKSSIIFGESVFGDARRTIVGGGKP